jgi:hypothetical protein
MSIGVAKLSIPGIFDLFSNSNKPFKAFLLIIGKEGGDIVFICFFLDPFTLFSLLGCFFFFFFSSGSCPELS